MAQILTDYDLSGGDTTSSVVSSPANVNLAWKVSGATDSNQVIQLQWWVQIGSEDYHQLPDENKKDIISKIEGNESDNTNVFGINATNLKIEVVVPVGADGTLNLWTVEN